MPKNSKSYDRSVRTRTTKRLCAISTEDSIYGGYQYFQHLATAFEDDFVIKVGEILPSVNGKTEPKRIFGPLVPYGYDLSYDTCWLVCDTDSWGEHKLDEVVNKCNNYKGCYAVISNNCFEIWLLYHQEGFNKAFVKSRECKVASEAFVHDRGGLENLISEETTDIAIEKAKSMPSATDSWPKTQGSHIFKLLEYLRTGKLPN